jgi:hypothetical protein
MPPDADYGSAQSWDDYDNAILGAGMLFGALALKRDSAAGITVEPVMDGDNVTNALLVKFDVGGPPAERGYLVTITVPPNDGSGT